MNAQARAAQPLVEEDGTIRITTQPIGAIPGCLLFTLEGYLDTYNTPYFQRQVSEAIRCGYVRIVFDCAQVSYMSSQPIGYFASLVKELRSLDGGFVLVQITRRVREVVQRLGLASWFPEAQTTEEALAFLSPEGGRSGPFPKVFDCPICRKKLRVLRDGRYRCRECKTVIVVEASGRFSIR